MPAAKTSKYESVLNALTYHKSMGRIKTFWQPDDETNEWCIMPNKENVLFWFTTPRAEAFCQGLALMERHYNRERAHMGQES